MDIDAVVLWVDGNDEEWQKEKARYSPDTYNNSVSRYRDWNLMKYWLECIRKFAPWIRTIHFVTYGHLPKDVDMTGVHIVNHRDFMPEGTLPTFNSAALEINIHRIEGLAEHFIYFNDDMFLTSPCSPEDFFDRNGLPRVRYLERPFRFKGNEMFKHHLVSSLNVINKNIQKKGFHKSACLKDFVYNTAERLLNHEYFVGFSLSHGVNPYLKSTFEEVWNAAPDTLMETSRQKFRKESNVNQCVMFFWQLAKNNYSPYILSNKVFEITDENITEICSAITGGRYKSICLNDPDDDIDFKSLSVRLQNAFAELLG